MKTIYIIRHAKSDWSIEGQSDIDRPLNARGYNDAHSIGKHFFQNGFKPQAMISSPAIRALTTALIISDEISFSKNLIMIDPELFETGEEEYLKAIMNLPKQVESIAIFGHNPIVSDLASSLSGQTVDMPTCAVARFSLMSDNWKKISRENIKFLEMITPKSMIRT